MGAICGFFGCLDRHILDSMSAILSHRGRKTFFHFERPIGLSQRTPLYKNFNSSLETPDATFFIIFDGDVFNKDELVNLLKENKYKIENLNDANILIGLYLTFGKEFPKYIDGPFSIAIFDGKKLFLARDRLGVKPLYYYCKNDTFLFGSEIKSVMQGMKEEIKIDVESLYERFVFIDHLIGDSTYFLNIKQLLPGKYCLVSYDNNLINFEIKDYGDVDKPKYRLEEGYLKKIIMETVERNVKYYAEQTDSVGILLSGGFDSSVLASIASKYVKKTLKTFTISDDENFPDIKAARKVAEHLGADHHEFIIDACANKFDLTQGIHLYEDIIIKDAILKLGKNVGGHVNIVISGTGADMFSLPVLLRHNKIKLIKKNWEVLSGDLACRTKNHRIRRYMENLLFSLKIDKEKAAFKHFTNDYLLNQLIPSQERPMMYFGTEAAFPFVDKTMFLISSAIPYKMKYYKNEEKPLLRRAFFNLNLPKSIITREKVCSKTNMRLTKNNIQKLADNLSDNYINNHPYKGLLGDRYKILCFDILKKIFVDNKGVLTNDSSLIGIYNK